MSKTRTTTSRRWIELPAALCTAVGVAVGMSGCGTATDATGSDAAQTNGAARGNEAAQPEIELVPIDRAGLDKVLADPHAKVVLVDYWGSWCVNCIQGFPHTVELHREYGDKGLKVISLAVEFDTEQGPTQALEILKKQKATFVNYVAANSYEDFDEASEAFDVAQFPTYRLFDDKGNLLATFDVSDPDKPIDHEEIEAAIRKQLGLPDEA